MVVRQGDVFWARLGTAHGSKPASRRPVVIVQRDAINLSHFNTVLVVPLTSQVHHAHLPGNVRLAKKEANLPQSSLARATHTMVVDKTRLTEKIGTLPQNRLDEILDAILWTLGKSS